MSFNASLETLQAFRTLSLAASTRKDASKTFYEEALAASEYLMSTSRSLAAASQEGKHAARLVLQWVISLVPGRKKDGGEETAEARHVITDERVWTVCHLALTSAPSKESSSFEAPPLSAGLPVAAVLALPQAIISLITTNESATSIASSLPEEQEGDQTEDMMEVSSSLPASKENKASEAAVQTFAALTGLTYPPLESWNLASLGGTGLPQMSPDKALDLVIGIIEKLRRRPHVPYGAELGTLALQYLVAVQTQQTSQRKAFTVIVSKLLHPMLALQHEPILQSNRALKRAIETVIAEILFHHEHIDGIRSLLAPGLGKRQKKGHKEKQDSVTTAALGAAANAQQWAAYQGQLLQALDGWLNAGKGEAEKEKVDDTISVIALSLSSIYRIFVRRLTMTAHAAAAPIVPPQLRSSDHGGDEERQQQGTKRKAAAPPSHQLDQSLISRPAFVFATRLWSMLWIGPKDRSASERTTLLLAARGIFEVVLQLGVYQYDSDRSTGGQYSAMESLFMELLKGCRDSKQDLGEITEAVVRAMEGEIRCLALMLRIDHRVTENALADVLALLASRFAQMNQFVAKGSKKKKDEGAKGLQHAAQILKQACFRTTAEVVDTYARLRQVEVVLTAFLSLPEKSHGIDMQAESLLEQSEVKAALSRGIRNCPPPQLVSLWDLLAASPVDDDDVKDSSILIDEPIRVQLFHILLENLRITSMNALNLFKRAQATMTSLQEVIDAIRKQNGTKKKKNDADMTKEKINVALGLYSKLMEVHVICDYWLAGEGLSDLPSPRGAGELFQSLRHDLMGSCKPALNRLAIGRLRQLLQEVKVRGISQDKASMEAKIEKEKTELTAFLFENSTAASTLDQGHGGLDLTLLGSSLPLWAPYCRVQDLDQFTRELLLLSERGGGRGTSAAFLTDASFFEVGPLAAHFLSSWTGLVVEAILGEVGKKGDGGAGEKEEGLAHSSDLQKVTAAFLDLWKDNKSLVRVAVSVVDGGKVGAAAGGGLFVKKLGKSLEKSKGVNERGMRRALHLIKLMNGLPFGYLPSTDQPRLFLIVVFLCGCLRRMSPGAATTADPSSSSDTLLPALCLALYTCALNAMRAARSEVAELIKGSEGLLSWLVATVIGENQEGQVKSMIEGRKREIGLETVGDYHLSLISYGDEDGIKHLLLALEQRYLARGLSVVNEDSTRRTGVMEIDGEEDALNGQKGEAVHCMQIISLLLEPYLSGSLVSAAEGNGEKEGAVVGWKHVTDLIARLRPQLVDVLGELRPEALILHSLLLEFDSKTNQSLSSTTKAIIQLPTESILTQALEKVNTYSEHNLTLKGMMSFFTACLKYLPVAAAEEGDGKRRKKKGVIEVTEERRCDVLETMVRLELAGLGDEAYACRDAFGVAAPSVQVRVMEKLESTMSKLGSVLEPSEAAAATLTRSCVLMTKLVEQAGMGTGPGAEALLGVANAILSQVLQCLARLVCQGLVIGGGEEAWPAGRALTAAVEREGDVGLAQALIEGLNLVRLYARKRWLLKSRADDMGRILASLAALPELLGQSIEARSNDGDRGGRQKGQGQGAKRSEKQPSSSSLLVSSYQAEEEVFGATYLLLSALLKYHARALYQCTPPLIHIIRALLRNITCKTSSSGLGPSAAKAWARLVEQLAGHSTALRKHFMLVLADYLAASPRLMPEIKTYLQPAAYALMDGLTSFEIQHLHAAMLDAAGQALLKKLHADYQQRYKYRGKV